MIHAFNPGWGRDDIREQFIAGTRSIFEAVNRSGVRRLLVVGGAGSLYVARACN